jgi:hypothetical protein
VDLKGLQHCGQVDGSSTECFTLNGQQSQPLLYCALLRIRIGFAESDPIWIRSDYSESILDTVPGTVHFFFLDKK